MSGGAPRGSFAIQTPDIQFSEWYAWDDVKDIPHGERTGLYIIARFDQKPEGKADHNAKEILYIGETHGKSQNIHKRLTMFFKAARVGDMIHKHSGGNRFNRELAGDLNNVYAAGFAPVIEDARYLNPFYILRRAQADLGIYHHARLDPPLQWLLSVIHAFKMLRKALLCSPNKR